MMKSVLKSDEPKELADYRERFARQASPAKREKFVKRKESKAVAERMLADQKGLCAYCEIDVTIRDRSVEHFIPRHLSTAEDNLNLDWRNLLLTCKGGLQADSVADSEAPSYRRSLPPNVEACCNARKGNFEPDGRLLNPLKLPPFPRLFRVGTLDGKLEADAAQCANAGIDPAHAEHTILVLGLNCVRLINNRLAVIEELERELQELDLNGADLDDNERALAKGHFGNGNGNWPAFFTAYRSFLGKSADDYLQQINYKG
jgi:uncharacterized protein (TIGR02646 family)